MNEAATAQTRSKTLDPFGYWPEKASAIKGLGGTAPGDPGSYAFHTHYTVCGPAEVRFDVCISDLQAAGGRLVLRVQRETSTGRVKRALQRTFPLPELIASNGLASISVPAKDGDAYALLGLIEEASPSATAIDVIVRYAPPDPDSDRRLQQARRRIFDRSPSAALRAIVSDGPATLADPGSQMCTSAQFEEPDYDRWVERLDLPSRHMHRKQWEFVYILQVLAKAGMLRTGRRGVGFGVGVERLPALFAAMGCEVVATDLPLGDARAAAWSDGHQHGASLSSLRYPRICDDDNFNARVNFRAVDMAHVPDDLTGFDFAWSSCAFEHLGSIPAGLRFVERSLDCLRPGGVAVHTTEFNLSSNGRTIDAGPTVLFRKRDIEALALRLHRLGHRVLPLRYDAGDGYADNYIDLPPYCGDAQLKIRLGGHMTTSFGFAVQKADEPASSLSRLRARIGF
jgi:SAM-dependent methyltransferase